MAKLAWSAPIRMLPPCLICWSTIAIVLAVTTKNNPVLYNLCWAAVMIVFLSLCVLLLGYGYVVLTILGLGIFRGLRLVTD
jgi:hypothetical protein